MWNIHIPSWRMAGFLPGKMAGRNPDTFQALFTYANGFLTSYSTSFGNDAPSFTRIMGKKATLINTGGEGSPRWQIVEEKGNHEDDRTVDSKRAVKDVLLPGDTSLPPMGWGMKNPRT